MSQNISFNIYVMSYQRPNVHLTEKVLEYCTYVVREEEAEDYKKNGHNNLLVIPTGEVSDFVSTFFWIIENTKEDVIAIVDDDVKYFMYRTIDCINIKSDEEGKILVSQELERIAQLIVDLDIGIAYPPMSKALYAYDREFNFLGVPGQLRIVNKKRFKATYNPKDDARGDIDICMQEILKNRICLREMYFLPNAFQDKILGKEEYDNRKEHYNYVYALMNKWGKYFDYDFKKNIAKIKIIR